MNQPLSRGPIPRSSWFGVIVHYVFDTNSGAHCRVVREATHGKVDDGSLLGQEEKKKAK